MSFSRLRIEPCQLLCFFLSFHKLVASLMQVPVRAATLLASDSNLGQLDEKLERYLCAMPLSLKLQPFSSSSWKVLDLRNLLQDIWETTSRQPHENRSPGAGCCHLNFLAVLLSMGAASVYLEHSWLFVVQINFLARYWLPLSIISDKMWASPTGSGVEGLSVPF